MTENDAFSSLFAPVPERSTPSASAESWKVLLVDDEPAIHATLRLALRNIVVEGHSLQLLEAQSAAEAGIRLTEHHDIALILLDVVMETELAGLELVRHIREDLCNHDVRIVLVTGQPGYAPQRDVVCEYDIDGYQLKSELTNDKIFTSVYTALRTHRVLRELKQRYSQLGVQTDALRKSENLLNSMTAAVPGVVYQFLRTSDGEWRFLYLSKGIENLYEVTAEEAYRDHHVMTDRIAPQYRTSHREAVEHSALTLRTWTHEHRIRTPSGKLKWVRGEAIPVRQEDASILWNGILTDITANKETELALAETQRLLQEKEERLALAAIHNGIGIWDWNLRTLEMVWDDSMFALYHMRRADFSGAVDAWEKSLHPADRERAEREVQEALDGVKPFDTEFRVCWPNGEIHHIKAVAKVFRDDADKPVRMLGTNIDITERRKADDALREQHEVYRAVADHGQALIWMAGLDRGYSYFNAPWLAFTGRTLEQEQGKGWMKGVHPDDFQHCLDIYEAAFDHREAFAIEYRLRRHDGAYRWILDEGTPRYDDYGNFVGFVGHCLDIAELKRVEMELRSIGERLQLALSGGELGLWDWHIPSGEVLYSEHWFLMLGLPMGTTKLDLDSWIKLIHPDDLASVNAALESHLKGQVPTYECEHRVRHQDGRWLWLLDRGKVVEWDKTGAPVRAVGTYFDITQRKQTSLELASSKNRYQGILDSMLEAYWRVDEKGRIVEVNQAICQMHGFSKEELLRMSISDFEVIESAEDTRRHIETILREGRDIFESRHRCRDGRIIDVEISANLASDAPGNIDAFHHDITERKRMEHEIRELAFHDPLTKLPNRHTLNDRLSQTMATSKRSGNYGALMMLDLDNFKQLNDAQGHHAGDLLLLEVARRLTESVRGTDTTARAGGDEFVVILGELNADPKESARQAGEVAEKIRVNLAAPYRLILTEGSLAGCAVEHLCSASIGVVLFLNHEASQADLLKWADSAMYQAKRAGRNAIRFYGLTP